MGASQDICAICREDFCDFETRCGHVFHEECLKVAVFSTKRNKCPYCRVEISPFKFLEAFICAKEDDDIDLESTDIESLKNTVKYCLTKEKLPIELIVQKMIDLCLDIDEMDFWLSKKQRNEKQSLFYASYVSGYSELSHKLIDLGCQLVRKKTENEIQIVDIKDYVKYNEIKVSEDDFSEDDDDEYYCSDSESEEIDVNENVMSFAVKINDMHFVQKLLDLGVDINSLDLNWSPLDVACENDNSELVAFLHEKGAKINLSNSEWKIVLKCKACMDIDIEYEVDVSPLTLACLNGSLNAIRTLHKYCPDLLSDDSVSWSAFAVAISLNNIQLIDLLIQLGGNINSVEAQFERNLLMIACIFGNVNVVKFVFENGQFDINIMDSLGNCTILYSKQHEIVKYLIENGADPLANTQDDKYTILHIACNDDNYELIEYLFSETIYAQIDLKTLSTAKKGLIELCLINHAINFKILDYLLQRGMDINEIDSNNVPFLARAYSCSTEGLKYLLEHGADVNSVDSDGINLLQNMFYNGRINIRSLLLLMDHGINLNSQSNDGRTIMHYILLCDLDIFDIMSAAEYLLESGARTDIPDNEGLFPFDLAFEKDPFSYVAKSMELNGSNYSKYISDEVRSNRCDHCMKLSASLKARCGHYLHINCLIKKTKCPVCDSRVTLSNVVENMIKEHCFSEISLLNDIELLCMLDNYIEDDRIIDFDTISDELKRRKALNKNFDITYCNYPKYIYAKACAYGRIELIKLLKSIKIVALNGYTIAYSIIFATASVNIEMVDLLLNDFGTKYVNYNIGRFNSVQSACIFRNSRLFDLFVGKGADLTVYYHNRNILQLACNFGSFEIVKKLVEDHGFDPISICYSKTPLHCLVEDVEKKIISNLESFCSPIEGLLHYIEKSEEECIEMAKYLLDRGANLNVVDEDHGETPVTLTGLYNREKVFDSFVDYSENVLKKPLKLKSHKKILISIAKCGKNLEFFEKVIKMGADVNWTDSEGVTALMEACESGNYEICRRLIELGANVNATCNYQLTALNYLCGKSDGNVKILELLVENGVDVHHITSDQRGALHFAAKSGSLTIVKRLLELGIDPNGRAFDFKTPLHFLFTWDWVDDANDTLAVAKVLVDAGADVNAADDNGDTPLSLTIKNLKYRKIAEYFKSIEN